MTRLLFGGLPDARRANVTGDLLEDFHERRRNGGRLRAATAALADAWSVRRAYRRSRRDEAGAARAETLTEVGRVLASSFSLRLLRRSPLFALGAALPLALGVTTLVGVAGFVEAVLLRPISRVDPDAVFRLRTTTANGVERSLFSYREFDVLRPPLSSSADLSAVHLAPVVIRVEGTTGQSLAEVVGGDYFRVAATVALTGRVLTETDDDRGAPPVVVISDPLWRSRFGRAPGAVGATIFLNNTPFTIVGVTPSGGAAAFVGASTDVWVPLQHATPLLDRDWAENAEHRIFTVLGRLATGQARDALEGPLTTATRTLIATFPTRRDDRLIAQEGRLLAGSQARTASGIAALLTVLAGLVFLLVTANVGGLFTARAMALGRQMAVRRSLGAPTSAVIADAVAEGAAVGALAGLGGVLG